MRVLVTGATGFTGGCLARHLVGAGDEVRALVRPVSQLRADGLREVGVQVATGDLGDARSLEAACLDVEVVYHIAATYRTAGQPATVYREVNVEGTRLLLDAAETTGVRRVVHCSTGGVHGHIEDPPATEEAPLAREARKLLAAYADMEELIRLGAYSSGSNPEVDRAIAVNEPLEAFLGQGKDETSSIGESFAHLAGILGDG